MTKYVVRLESDGDKPGKKIGETDVLSMVSFIIQDYVINKWDKFVKFNRNTIKVWDGIEEDTGTCPWSLFVDETGLPLRFEIHRKD